MSTTTEKEYEHLGDSRGCADHDHDLVHELSRRLDCLWRYDQFIANADGQTELQKFWRSAKAEELENIKQLKKVATRYALLRSQRILRFFSVK